MKKIIFILLLVASSFAIDTNCCLKPLLDSLKAVPTWKWASYPFIVTFYRYDSTFTKNPCDSFQFTWIKSGGHEDTKWTSYHFKKIAPTTYTKYMRVTYESTGRTTIYPTDTVRNFCILSSIENRPTAIDGKILYIKIYDIQGRLIGDYNTLNINKLDGIYFFKYFTENGSYIRKKILK